MRLRYRNGAERVPEQTRSRRQGPRGLFAGDRADILQGRGGSQLSHRDHALRGGVMGMQRLFDRVLVTGGAGYCGARLIPQLLARGYKITVYDIMFFGNSFLPRDNPNLRIVDGDIRDT